MQSRDQQQNLVEEHEEDEEQENEEQETQVENSNPIVTSFRIAPSMAERVGGGIQRMFYTSPFYLSRWRPASISGNGSDVSESLVDSHMNNTSTSSEISIPTIQVEDESGTPLSEQSSNNNNNANSFAPGPSNSSSSSMARRFFPFASSSRHDSSRHRYDGVWSNLNAKPSAGEKTQDENPPSYEQAAADAVPSYWESSVLTGGLDPDELYIEGLPVGSFLSFVGNVLSKFFTLTQLFSFHIYYYYDLFGKDI